MDRNLSKRVTVLFLLTRSIAWALGVRYDTSSLPSFFQFLDTELLRGRLLESLANLHSQPPLWNGYLGLVLQLAGSRSDFVFALLAHAAGLLLALTLAHLALEAGLPSRDAFLVTALFSASPAAILFENFLFYPHFVATLLASAAFFFARYARRGRRFDGFAAFSLLSAVVLTRSLFHVVFLAIPIGILLVLRPERVRTLAVASLPAAAAIALFVRNLLLFGFFGSSSWFGMSFAKMTTFSIPHEERIAMVELGELSAAARVRPFSGVEVLRKLVPESAATGIPALDSETRNGRFPNFNHRSIPAVSKLYQADAVRTLRLRPSAYFRSLLDSVYVFFQPPSDHFSLARNRETISWIDRVWDFVGYGQLWQYDNYSSIRQKEPPGHFLLMFVSTPWPFLLLFGVVLLSTFRRVLSVVVTGAGDRAEAAVLAFLASTVLFVATVGNLLEVGENNRFRFEVEPMIVLLAVLWWRRRTGRPKLEHPTDAPNGA